MTVPEVATAFRISEETVRQWAREGRLHPVPLPSRIKRFRREEVEAILAGLPEVPAAMGAERAA